MKLAKTFYASNRRAWRFWLAKHHSREKEVWLVYPRKSSGKPRIPYNDAVEEALCYGWIDSNLKGIDDESYAQRFSPRKPTSKLSQMNKERIRKLITNKKMTAAGIAAVAKIFDLKKDKTEKFTIPSDILDAIKANKQAWKNFHKLPETYKRIRIAFIESRKRHGKKMFQKSLQHFIQMTAKNKRFGFIRE